MATRKSRINAAKPKADAAAGPDRFSIEAEGCVDLQAAKGEGKRPTFSILGYTGGVMNIGGFFNPVIVDLAGLTATSQQMPALLAHDDEQIVGQTSSVKVDASGAHFDGVVTGDNDAANEVVSQAKNGFNWRASIGASISRREFLDSGKTATVNGREVTGPLVIAREAQLLEISFVAIPADSQTTADVAASLNHGATTQETPPMNDFEKWLKAKNIDAATLDETVKATLKAAFDAEVTAAKPDPRKTETLAQVVEARRKEDERVEKITQIAKAAIDARPILLEEFNKMAQAAINANSTVDQFELEIMRLRATVAPGAYIPKGDVRAGKKVIEAALCLGGGMREPEKHFDEKTLNAASDRFPHGLGLCDVLLMAARENGYTGHGSKDVRGLLRAAFGGMDIRADGFSTFDIPGILGNVANKFLLAGFNAVEAGWRDIADIRSVKDFKTATNYSLTGSMMYEKVGPTGELKHATVSELSYTIKAETYGRLFAITRQDIINDDLGALTKVPQKIGRGAALKLNDVFWTEFLASITTFWHTSHNNVISSSTSVLQSSALTLAVAKFRKQTDPDGLPIGISPAILLVPPELETIASELMTSQMVNTGGSSTTDKVPNRNIWAGKYKIVMSTYLSNTAYTGYSTTHWFLLADPADLSTIEVAFLNGKETPTVEQADADFDTLGIQMRGFHDFGVSKQEYRASVRAVGA